MMAAIAGMIAAAMQAYLKPRTTSPPAMPYAFIAMALVSAPVMPLQA